MNGNTVETAAAYPYTVTCAAGEPMHDAWEDEGRYLAQCDGPFVADQHFTIAPWP